MSATVGKWYPLIVWWQLKLSFMGTDRNVVRAHTHGVRTVYTSRFFVYKNPRAISSESLPCQMANDSRAFSSNPSTNGGNHAAMSSSKNKSDVMKKINMLCCITEPDRCFSRLLHLAGPPTIYGTHPINRVVPDLTG